MILPKGPFETAEEAQAVCDEYEEQGGRTVAPPYVRFIDEWDRKGEWYCMGLCAWGAQAEDRGARVV